jgi:hypothetical protein
LAEFVLKLFLFFLNIFQEIEIALQAALGRLIFSRSSPIATTVNSSAEQRLPCSYNNTPPLSVLTPHHPITCIFPPFIFSF